MERNTFSHLLIFERISFPFMKALAVECAWIFTYSFIIMHVQQHSCYFLPKIVRSSLWSEKNWPCVMVWCLVVYECHVCYMFQSSSVNCIHPFIPKFIMINVVKFSNTQTQLAYSSNTSRPRIVPVHVSVLLPVLNEINPALEYYPHQMWMMIPLQAMKSLKTMKRLWTMSSDWLYSTLH